MIHPPQARGGRHASRRPPQRFITEQQPAELARLIAGAQPHRPIPGRVVMRPGEAFPEVTQTAGDTRLPGFADDEEQVAVVDRTGERALATDGVVEGQHARFALAMGHMVVAPQPLGDGQQRVESLTRALGSQVRAILGQQL